MKKKYDIVIAGCGTAGAVSALYAAKEGFNVLVIDAKEFSQIGNKVCGDAIHERYFGRFKDEIGLYPPEGDELGSKIRYTRMMSSDMSTFLTVEDHGYTIYRHRFGQRLANMVKDSGVELLDAHLVEGVIISKNLIEAIRVKDKRKNNIFQVTADIFIDTTGVYGKIKSGIDFPGNERNVSRDDYGICYREILRLKQKIDDIDTLRVIFDQDSTAGGYIWIFPKDEQVVNVGVGLTMIEGHKNPRVVYKRFINEHPLFDGAEVLHSGGGVVPMRRALASLVGENLLIAGDAGCQVNPLHGGGLGYSMEAGRLAALTAKMALERDEVSQQGMWEYNMRWMRENGGKHAALELFKIAIQSMTNEEIKFGLSGALITDKDIYRINKTGQIKLSLYEKFLRLIKGRKHLGVIKSLYIVSNQMKRIKNLYLRYPEKSSELPQWVSQVEAIIDETKRRFPLRCCVG